MDELKAEYAKLQSQLEVSQSQLEASQSQLEASQGQIQQLQAELSETLEVSQSNPPTQTHSYYYLLECFSFESG